MELNSWDECLEQNIVYKVSKDISKIKSLIEIAEDRIKYCEKQEINKLSAIFIFENYYSAALELLHALALKSNFKIMNHKCLSFFLKEIQKKEKLFRLFERFRINRNHVIYYGNKIDLETCKKLITDCIYLIKKLRELLK